MNVAFMRFSRASSLLQSSTYLVGASLLAMVVNDDEGCLNERGVLAFFASKLAPTEERSL